MSLFGVRAPWGITGHAADALSRPLSIDPDGWLSGADARVVPSVRHSPLTTPYAHPIAIVWHYTATDHGTAAALAKRIRTYRRGVDRPASWHVCIDASGLLWQSVSFQRGAWHCGRGTIGHHRVNACSVGVELEGHGDWFPDPQRQAARRLIGLLAVEYNINREDAARGHVDFDPARRTDPGELWSGTVLPTLLEQAYSDGGDQ